MAWQTNFITLSDPVTDLAFVRDSASDPYPAGGLDSHLTNDAGEAIHLFSDLGSHVVIGKTLGGQVCFVLALDEHSSEGQVTGGTHQGRPEPGGPSSLRGRALFCDFADPGARIYARRLNFGHHRSLSVTALEASL